MNQEHYTYFLVWGTHEEQVDNLSIAKKKLLTTSLPVELQARFNGGWLTYNINKGYFE